MINPNYKLTKISYPYKIWVVDDFLSSEYLSKVVSNWPHIDLPNWNKGVGKIFDKKGVLEDRMIAISGKDNIPKLYRNFLSEMESTEVVKFFQNLTSMQNILPDKSWRWSGLRQTLAGGHQLVHADARQHLESGLTKELTLLLYLNEDYEEERDAGQLEIWSADMKEMIHSLPPLFNRLIIFHNTDTSYHGVPLTKSDRKMITWSMLSNKMSQGHTKARFVPRPDDSEEVHRLSSERLSVKDKFTK